MIIAKGIIDITHHAFRGKVNSISEMLYLQYDPILLIS